MSLLETILAGTANENVRPVDASSSLQDKISKLFTTSMEKNGGDYTAGMMYALLQQAVQRAPLEQTINTMLTNLTLYGTINPSNKE